MHPSQSPKRRVVKKMKTKTALLTLVLVSLAFASQVSFADPSQKVCKVERQEQYRDKPLLLEDLRTHLSEQGCEKGDLLELEWSDSGIIYACDFEKPMVRVANHTLACTYLGTLRERKN